MKVISGMSPAVSAVGVVRLITRALREQDFMTDLTNITSRGRFRVHFLFGITGPLENTVLHLYFVCIIIKFVFDVADR